MHVVLSVTPVAVGCQRDFDNVLGRVAGVAIEAAVRPGQGVTCLCIVVEAPSRPTGRAVAERTICPQTSLVMLVPVARAARERRVLEPQ